jgi:hypothetical protein
MIHNEEREDLQALTLRALKTEVVLPTLHEIVSRLHTQAETAGTDEAKTRAKRKKAYWDALLTLVYAGFLE